MILLATVPWESQAQHVIQLLVALCDNVDEGIVKVPTAWGNGQDPNKNLY